MNTLILAIVMGWASALAVVATPALPLMAKALSLRHEQILLIVSIYLFGYAFGNLLYGPFSNKHGRKGALHLAAAIALVGTILTALVSQRELYWLLLLGRVITAIGATGGMAMAIAMVGDRYEGKKATQKLALLLLGFALVPSIMIAVGGALTEHFGWRSCFYFSIAYTLFIWLLTLPLPETHLREEPFPLTVKEQYTRKLRTPRVVLGAFLRAVGGCWIYLFSSQAPFIGITLIGLSPEIFGLYSLIPPAGSIVGSLFSHQLAEKKEALASVGVGIAIGTLAAIAMTLFFLFGLVNVWTLFLPAPFFFMSSAIISSNASSLVLARMRDKGSAAAILNFLGLTGVGIVMVLVSLLPTRVPALFALSLVALGLIGLVLRTSLKKHV